MSGGSVGVEAGDADVAGAQDGRRGEREAHEPDSPALTRGLCELTLETRDLAALEEFYAGLLGLGVIDRADDRIWLAAGPRARLGLWSPGEKEFDDRGGRHVHFALSVAPGALEELAERARARDGDVRGPVEHDGGDRSLYLRDPAGNVVELWDFFERGNGVGELAE